MTAERVFVDTNIFVYAVDASAGAKHDAARHALDELWRTESGALSTQVLQEFYVTVTRELPRPMAKRTARDLVADYDAWTPYRPETSDVLAASELAERHRLSFWDALIIVSAQRAGASVLLSEDLKDGQAFGPVTVTNPSRCGPF